MVTVAISGLGSRGKDTYAKCQHLFPDRMKIVAIADIVPEKVEEVRQEYGVDPQMCFSSAEEMLEKGKLADVMFICTQDRQHYGHAMKALEQGYDLLLEKPISPDPSECREIEKTAKQLGRRVVVCHVLRYTPFYQFLRKTIVSGQIGRVVCIQAVENVGYWHQAHSFVRGNWRNSDLSSPMILQKSCHDMDILLWLSGQKCKRISSYGSLMHFRPENAPEGSAERCLECGARENCPYDAQKIYLTDENTGLLHGHNGWPANVVAQNPTEESVLEALRTGPYGRCVYHCDNNVVDHQVVNMEMEDGSTVSFTMCAFNQGGRSIKIMGTMGEIVGDMSANTITVTVFGQKPVTTDVRTLAKDFSGHGGGDNRLVQDLLNLEEGNSGEALTSIEKSMESHYMAFAAEYSRLHHGESVELGSWFCPRLHKVQEDELDKLAEFAAGVWHEHYDSLLGSTQVDYMVEKFQSAPAIRHQMDSGYEYYTVLDSESGELMGFCGIHPEPQEHSLFLSKLYIGAQYRRKGLATMVMSFLEDYAHKMNADRIWLTVNKYNTGSITAYLRFGFQVVRQEVTDIGSGYVMDDYIMEKRIRFDGGTE